MEHAWKWSLQTSFWTCLSCALILSKCQSFEVQYNPLSRTIYNKAGSNLLHTRPSLNTAAKYKTGKRWGFFFHSSVVVFFFFKHALVFFGVSLVCYNVHETESKLHNLPSFRKLIVKWDEALVSFQFLKAAQNRSEAKKTETVRGEVEKVR